MIDIYFSIAGLFAFIYLLIVLPREISFYWSYGTNITIADTIFCIYTSVFFGLCWPLFIVVPISYAAAYIRSRY